MRNRNNCTPDPDALRGFTLIEVTLALMVVTVGLMAVFHLFPAGLRASRDATAETRIAGFADEVFNQFYAETAEDPALWQAVQAGGGSLVLDFPGLAGAPTRTVNLNGGGTVEYPPGTREYVRYTCKADVEGHVARADLRVAYGRVGGYTNAFHAEVYDYGM